MLLIIISLLAILLWVYIFNYLLKLEKIACECALDWRRIFIMIYIIFLISILILRSINILNDKNDMIIRSLFAIVTLVFIGVVYSYIRYLKKDKCDCSKDLARDILEIFNYIQIGLVGLLIIILFYIIVMIQRSGYKLKRTKLNKM